MKAVMIGVGSLWCALFLAQPASAQEDDSEEEETEEETEEEKPPPLTDREKKVLALFNATEARYEQGHLVLLYNFETRKEDLLEDWKPAMEETQKRIRWTVAKEGPTVTGKDEDGYKTVISLPGIMIGDHGQWLHKAIFQPEIEVEVRIFSKAHPRAGTILGPIYYNPKKKRALGVNSGHQLMCVGGAKPAPVKPSYPKVERLIAQGVGQTLGLKYSKGRLEAYRDGKKTVDSTGAPKFTDGFDSGHAGLAWNGAVQCYVRWIRIRGRLDPDWTAEALGERSGRSPGGE